MIRYWIFYKCYFIYINVSNVSKRNFCPCSIAKLTIDAPSCFCHSRTFLESILRKSIEGSISTRLIPFLASVINCFSIIGSYRFALQNLFEKARQIILNLSWLPVSCIFNIWLKVFIAVNSIIALAKRSWNTSSYRLNIYLSKIGIYTTFIFIIHYSVISVILSFLTLTSNRLLLYF